MSVEHAQRAVLATTILVSSLWWLAGLEAGWVLFVPWALSVVLFGIPHGAADHVVWSSIRGESGKFAPVVARYLFVMVMYALVWWVLPSLAVSIFLLITIWHWGSADATRSFYRAGAGWMTSFWMAASVLRGVVPILAPLAFYPESVLTVVADWSSTLTEAQLAGWVPETETVVVIVLLTQCLWLMIMKHIGASVKIEALETALVTILLLAVHPLISVGVYFTFWHAWNHDRRLVAWYAEARNGIYNRSKRRDQIIIMAFTLVGLLALVGLMPPGPSTLSVYLIAISILTLPHMLVVWMMDRRGHQISHLKA